MQQKMNAYLAIVLMIVGIGGCSSATFQYDRGSIEQSIEFQKADTFCVNIPNGTLNIEGWDKPSVSLSAKIKAHGMTAKSAKRLAEETTIELKRNHEGVFVAYAPALLPMKGEYVETHMVIHVPYHATTTAETAYGNVTVKQTGSLKLNTAYGDIKLDGIQGPVVCHTAYGDINITKCSGDVACNSSYGDLKIENIDGAIGCSTAYGDITLTDVRSTVKGNTSYGDIHISIQKKYWVGQAIDLNTAYGNVCFMIENSK